MVSSDESSDDGAYGPALPPHLQNKSPQEGIKPKPSVIIGPQIPPSLMKKIGSQKEAASHSKLGGKSISDEVNNSSDDDFDIGPYPPDDPRSKLVPLGKLPTVASAIPTKREEWMLVCPANRSLADSVGLGPRKFLAKTPEEPKLREKIDSDEDEEEDFLETARAELEAKREKERDEEMAGILKSEGRDESLLSLHKKKRKIDEGKNDGEPKERRPFDRDLDLKVNGLSEKDKEKFINKCGELGNRFKGGLLCPHNHHSYTDHFLRGSTLSEATAKIPSKQQ